MKRTLALLLALVMVLTVTAMVAATDDPIEVGGNVTILNDPIEVGGNAPAN